MSLFIKISTALAAALACAAVSAAPAPDHSQFGASTPSSTCLSCHGPKAAVAKRTAKLNPNPHDSHRGFVDCMECHAFGPKAKPVLMCNDCHAFETRDGFHIVSRKAKP